MSERPPSTAPAPPRTGGVRVWILFLLPLVLVAGLVWIVVASDPAARLRGDLPPVEELAFQRVELRDTGIVATVLNDGPDPVTIAQVMVDDAYWAFVQEPLGPLSHLASVRLSIPYPWVENETHVIRLVTSSGLTFDHEIAVARETPRPSWQFFAWFALIGLYVGVIPVAVGLLWYPAIGRVGRRGLDFVLALTVGLLIFLFVDTVEDGLEAAGGLAASFQGTVLFTLVALLAFLAIEAFGERLAHGLEGRGGRARRQPEPGEAAPGPGADRGPLVTSLLIAVGIGLHNFGEGLAIGAAYSLGEVTLGALLIVGFTLHNTTEGLAIVAPLAESRAALSHLVLVGMVAGAPTIAGAWLGGLVYSPLWSVVFLAIAAGAIAQVVILIGRQMTRERQLGTLVASRPVMAGLVAGFAVMYATGLLV
ncbi:MAG TPA: metal transporter [Thermoanaerobaculia bacterium]|nr:metal transporter [Thermoanaerobaculia bacterium]